MSRALVLFTETYPYAGGAEETFLEPELRILARLFPSIRIVPRRLDGEPFPVDDTIVVDRGLADTFATMSWWRLAGYRLRSLLDPHVASDLLAGAPTSSRIHAWRYAVRQQRDALVTRDWLRRRIADGVDASSSTLYYTYWLTPVTAGIVAAMRGRRKEARSRIVSRAHRYDLYEAPEHRVQHPARQRLLQGLSRLYLISEHGLTYVTDRYPRASHYEVSRLGVPDPRGLARPSEDGVLRVVSCSFVVPVKRVELLYAALGELAARHVGAIEWTHIGDGPQFQALKELTGSAPANLTVRLLGRRSNAEVIADYLSRPVDVFVNVSSSEGIPVAIMEAQSCGIPVVATNVGGMAEIVSEAVGVLLPANPATADIASAIERMGPWHRDAASRRAASRENWQRRFFADANYEAFARSLCDLTS